MDRSGVWNAADLFIYLRERELRGGAERRESQADSVPSGEPDVGLDPTTLRSRPELKPKVGHLTDCHPGFFWPVLPPVAVVFCPQSRVVWPPLSMPHLSRDVTDMLRKQKLSGPDWVPARDAWRALL